MVVIMILNVMIARLIHERQKWFPQLNYNTVIMTSELIVIEIRVRILSMDRGSYENECDSDCDKWRSCYNWTSSPDING